ncbi:MAG: hypothetical protein H6515_14650 [Microthrixaceae bacterium]|nr:hypothetical protein [Microthrixaceae bacterium]
MTDGVPLDDALTGLAALVSARMIQGHLINRPAHVLDPDGEDFPLVLDHVRGIAAEVTAIAGIPPEGSARRDLAVTAISVGVARNLEEALFPEQQLGDSTRAEQLERRYLALLKLLAGMSSEDNDDGSNPGADGVIRPPAPRGTFPDPMLYPDPVGYAPRRAW